MLPPSQDNGADMRIWPGTKLGDFSISSAYSLICGHGNNDKDPFWKKIWQIEAPERVRSLIWRINHGRLPTNEKRHKWGLSSPYCYHYYDKIESIIHVLRDCPLASLMWVNLLAPQSLVHFFSTDLISWVKDNLIRDWGRDNSFQWSSIWAQGCALLWKWRNEGIFKDNFIRPHNPWSVIIHYVSCYKMACSSSSVVVEPPKVQRLIRWFPPPTGSVCVNTDGASKAINGAAGCGGLIRDEHGVWLGGFAMNLGSCSAFVAELWGVLQIIRLAHRKGFTSISLQFDSQSVASILQGAHLGNTSGYSIVTQIRKLLHLPWQVSVQHIYREANKCADAMANIGCNSDWGISFFDNPPPQVASLMLFDVMGGSSPRFIPA
ncbi:hypothetical protein RIF29_20042 [Crotalaria pallida]|uniref:RNase H type-1 domain-containing protein n=1 Tax=Crotalaria pallida TaxID=3830 RepID=A0AAN9IBZ9_CROPI